MVSWQFCWWPFRDDFCDPNSKVIGDLQQSGIKRSRLESPGFLFFRSPIYKNFLTKYSSIPGWLVVPLEGQKWKKNDWKMKRSSSWMIPLESLGFFPTVWTHQRSSGMFHVAVQLDDKCVFQCLNDLNLVIFTMWKMVDFLADFHPGVFHGWTWSCR